MTDISVVSIKGFAIPTHIISDIDILCHYLDTNPSLGSLSRSLKTMTWIRYPNSHTSGDVDRYLIRILSNGLVSVTDKQIQCCFNPAMSNTHLRGHELFSLDVANVAFSKYAYIDGDDGDIRLDPLQFLLFNGLCNVLGVESMSQCSVKIDSVVRYLYNMVIPSDYKISDPKYDFRSPIWESMLYCRQDEVCLTGYGVHVARSLHKSGFLWFEDHLVNNRRGYYSPWAGDKPLP
jgi:hypothetical protein